MILRKTVQHCHTRGCTEEVDWVQAMYWCHQHTVLFCLFLLPTVQDKDGRNALHLAFLNGHASLARDLVTLYRLHPNTASKVRGSYVCMLRIWGVVVVFLVANTNFSLTWCPRAITKLGLVSRVWVVSQWIHCDWTDCRTAPSLYEIDAIFVPYRENTWLRTFLMKVDNSYCESMYM